MGAYITVRVLKRGRNGALVAKKRVALAERGVDNVRLVAPTDEALAIFPGSLLQYITHERML